MDNNFSSADELKTIRRIMEESTRFLSLSGLSGVFAGLFAIAGALVAWLFILKGGTIHYDEYFRSLNATETGSMRAWLLTDAVAVLILSAASLFYFSGRKAKKAGMNFWTPVSKRLLVNFSIPLATGGAFVLILLIQNHVQLIAPGMLIFYGLALLNAGKFTYGEIFYLGVLEVVVGLIAALAPSFGLYFWTFGFGILHVVYGILMYRKYES